MRVRRVRALHRARPDPGNHRELLSLKGLQVWALLDHFGGDFGLRIKVADALLRFGAHPGAVVPDVLSEPRRSRPGGALHLGARRKRAHRGPARELWWNLY